MDTQNVSAQLYMKQLPNDSMESSYCGDSNGYLNTCVNATKSDAMIENAFQQQMELAEIFKSPQIFENTKNTFMNQVMGYTEPGPVSEITQLIPRESSRRIPKETMKPSKSLPSTVKESFGEMSSGTKTALIVVVLIILAILIIMGMGGI